MSSEDKKKLSPLFEKKNHNKFDRFCCWSEYNIMLINSEFWGGGVAFLQGFEPLPTQRVPLCTILRYPFLLTHPKIFLKAPLASIYTIFEGVLVFF